MHDNLMPTICRAACTVLLLLSVVGAASASSAEPNPCAEATFSRTDCDRQVEKQLGKRQPRLFRRDGKVLRIHLPNGLRKTYIDTPSDGWPNTHYSLVKLYPDIGYALIHAVYYEGDSYTLLHLKTGGEFDVASPPVVSPDKKRLAIANADLESQYTPNSLAVYTLHPSGLRMELNLTPEEWGAQGLRWVSNTEIRFVEWRFDYKYDVQERPRQLVHHRDKRTGAGTWTIAALPMLPFPEEAKQRMQQVLQASQQQEVAALRPLLADPFRWDGWPEQDKPDAAVAAYQREPDMLRELARVLQSRCEMTVAGEIDCATSDGKPARAGFRLTGTGWRMAYFLTKT